jgi:hypothetical protein
MNTVRVPDATSDALKIGIVSASLCAASVPGEISKRFLIVVLKYYERDCDVCKSPGLEWYKT